MHFFTWVLALCIPIGLQLNFKFLEKVIDLLIILTNCLNRLQNRNYILTMDIIEDVVLEDSEASLNESDEFYRRLNKMNEKVKENYSLNETNNNPEQDDTNQEDNFNQEQYYKEMEEMQEQVNKLSQLQELTQLPELQDKELQSHDSTPEEYKDIEHIVAKVNLVNNKIYIDESLE